KDKKDESVEFVNLLLELSNQDQMPIYTVLTMRSDFIGDCSQFQGLPEALNQSQYLVPKLTRDQLKLAIEGPAKLYGRQITPRLLSRLINDLNGVKVDLPLLQHCLLRIWEYEEKEDNNQELDINDYKAIGTVENALAQHANQALEKLNPKQKKLAEYIFKALTTIDDNGRKIRRPALLSDLAALTKSSSEEILEVANKFIEDGRSFLILQKIGGSSDVNIDISHESLIRQWDTLSRWVEEEAEAASTYLQIAKANSLKKESKRGYLDGIELQLAQKWRANNNPSAEWAKGYRHDYAEVISFLEESEDEYLKNERKKRARTRWIQGLMVGVIILLLIAVGAGYWYIQKEETRSAAQEKHLAAVEILMDDPTKAYALEEEAYSIFPDTVYTNSAQKIKETYTLYKNRANFSDEPLKENVYRPNAISQTGEWIFYKDSTGVGILQNNANKNKREFNANVLTSSMNLSDFFIYGTDERKVLKYDYESQEQKEIFSLADDEVTFLTTDNDRIFVGTNKARVYQLSVNGDVQQEWSFRAETNVEDMPYAPIYDIAVGPGQRLAVVDRKGRVFITKDSDFEQLDLSGKALVTDISNSSTIAIGFSNGAIKLFDIEGGSISNFKAHAQSVNYLSFVGSGDFILSSSNKGETVLWNLEGDRRQGFTGHKKSVFGHILENKGNTLITYSLDGSIKEWNLNESLGGIYLAVLGENLTTNILSKKDKGPLLYNQDKIITHYLSKNGLDKIDLDSGIQSSIETSGQTCSGFIRKIAISPDKQNILGFCDTSDLVIINAEGEIIQRFPDQGIVKDLAFAPDGKSVLIGLLTGIVKKYSIETGAEENSFAGHTFGVSAIAVSSSAQNLMAVGTDDHSIKI
ncbi:MAG: hypothetical protein R3213_08120, partial [Flavobacteriaceae bacterium]|nr:hypothetical protein [Flavobacteriaceae bacterium]